MKSYIEEHSDANQGEVAVYNNLANEIDALANILQLTASLIKPTASPGRINLL